jgi:hypothetical protein
VPSRRPEDLRVSRAHSASVCVCCRFGLAKKRRNARSDLDGVPLCAGGLRPLQIGAAGRDRRHPTHTLNHQQPRHGRWPKAQTASPFRCNAVCIVTASVTGRRGNRSAKRGWPWGRAGRRDALVFPTWDGKPQSPTPVGLHVHALRQVSPHVRHDKAAEVMEALFAKVSAE